MRRTAILYGIYTALHITFAQKFCPKRWIHARSIGKCILIVNKMMNQANANKFCMGLKNNSKLLEIKNSRENDFIHELNFKGFTWLSARAHFDIIDSNAGLFNPGYVFRWSDGEPLKYSNWDSEQSESIEGENNCILVDYRGRWKRKNCTEKSNFLCEVDETVPMKKNRCPMRWILNSKTNSCYQVLKQKNSTILEMDEKCEEYGKRERKQATLTSIENADENIFVLSIVRSKHQYFNQIILGAIGESRSRTNWKWIDGTTFLNYQNWDDYMPSGNRKRAGLAMNNQGKWFNIYVNKQNPEEISIAVCKMLLS